MQENGEASFRFARIGRAQARQVAGPAVGPTCVPAQGIPKREVDDEDELPFIGRSNKRYPQIHPSSLASAVMPPEWVMRASAACALRAGTSESPQGD